MGASFNKSLAEVRESFEWLKDTFSYLKNEKNVQKIVWNANRQNKRQPFLRLLERFGENKGEYWQISAEQFSILNFANLLQFERSETACSQLELFNTKITHGYFLKFSIKESLTPDQLHYNMYCK